jgi:hypothetical protein
MCLNLPQPPGLQEALGLCESATLKQDLTVLHACFNKAAIPNLYLNFLRHYRENPAYFPAVYTGHTRAKAQRDPAVVAAAAAKARVVVRRTKSSTG